MNTFQNKYDTIEELVYEDGLRIEKLVFDEATRSMTILLNNNLSIRTPLQHYVALASASLSSLENYRLIADGTGIHWPALDEDLSLKGFLREFLQHELRSERQLVIS